MAKAKAMKGPSVGAVLLSRVDTLLTILGGEPKHASLDAAYLAVKEAYERIMGTPVRDTPNFTDKGDRLVIPAQPSADPSEAWDREPIKPVTVEQLDEDGFVKEPEPEAEGAEKEDSTNASGQPSATSGNGDSGAPSGQTV